MNVLIVESIPAGHRLNNAGLILEAICRLPGCRAFFLTCPSALKTEQYAMWIQPRIEVGSITVDDSLMETPDASSVGWKQIKPQIKLIREAIGRHKIDHVLIPSGDGIVQIAAASRLFHSLHCRKGVEVEAMMLRGRFAYESPRSFREWLARAGWFASVKHAPIDVIHHMDPMIFQAALTRSPGLSSRLKLIPDPVDPIEADLTIDEARQKLNLPRSGRMAGCVGFMDQRKGIDVFLRAYAASLKAGTLRSESDRILLVGKQDGFVANLLATEMKSLVSDGAIIVIPKFVNDTEMSNAISAMNLVVTPYPRHIGSASIVIRGAAQRRPVLAHDFGWLRGVIPRFDLGDVCDVLNPSAFAQSLAAAMNASGQYVQSERAKRFVKFCSVSNYQAHWTQRICKRLGIASPSLFAWDNVINQAADRSTSDGTDKVLECH